MTESYHHGDLKNALIQAGLEILAREGLEALSLRKVAKQAGVSHAAPYAHFADKQALIAAISTEGHRRIYDKISVVLAAYPDNPKTQLREVALAYLQFSQDEPALFRITFAGAVAQERNYPDLVEMAHRNFAFIHGIVVRGQETGIFPPGSALVLTQILWAAVHGMITLIQQGQVSSAVLTQVSPRNLVIFALEHFFSFSSHVQE